MIHAALLNTLLRRLIRGHTRLTFPRYALLMGDARYSVAIEIRPAVPEGADGIARTFPESAEYHEAGNEAA